MKILFLSLSTAIKDLKNRGIYPDLINYFIKQGHELFIVCPVERRLKTGTFLKKENKVTILGVKTFNITKSNFLEKGLATLLIENQFEAAIQKHLSGHQFDLILYTTPPITFNALIRRFKTKHQTKTYLMLKDIFPQNAVDLGLIKKKSLIYRYFRKKEELLYSISDHIGCMSEANVAYVLQNNPEIQSDKVEICPNAIQIVDRNSGVDKTAMREKFNIPPRVPVFLYGGNLGIAQGVPFLIELLESNKSRNDCFFLIIGGGNRYEMLYKWISLNQPTNAKLIHFMDRKDYDRVESICDVGMVFLDKNFTIPNFPSRILSYMECKLPLLISTDAVSDVGSIASANDFGLWSESGSIEDFNRNLNFYIENNEARTQMGENGFEFLKRNYDVAVSYDIIMNHFK